MLFFPDGRVLLNFADGHAAQATGFCALTAKRGSLAANPFAILLCGVEAEMLGGVSVRIGVVPIELGSADI